MDETELDGDGRKRTPDQACLYGPITLMACLLSAMLAAFIHFVWLDARLDARLRADVERQDEAITRLEQSLRAAREDMTQLRELLLRHPATRVLKASDLKPGMRVRVFEGRPGEATYVEVLP